MIKKPSHREEGGQAWLVTGESKILPRSPFFPLAGFCHWHWHWLQSFGANICGALYTPPNLHSQMPADKSEKARRNPPSRSRRPHRSPHSYSTCTRTQVLGFSLPHFTQPFWPRARGSLRAALQRVLPHQLSRVTHSGRRGSTAPFAAPPAPRLHIC